jgi:hypothetical protein
VSEPPSISRVTVGGIIAHPVTGALATGTARAAIPVALDVPVDGYVLGPGEAVTFVISDGVFVGDPPSLPATDDPDFSQQNWLYEWSIQTDVWTERFHAPLPASPSTTTLARIHSLAVPNPPPPATLYVPLTSVGQPGGPAGPLGEDGTLPQAAVAGLTAALGDKATAADLAGEVARAEAAEADKANAADLAVLASSTATALAGKASTGDLTSETDRAEAAEAGLVPLDTVTTKGDLVVASGAGTVARLPVGSDNQVLTANAAAPDGVDWRDAGGGGSGFSPVFVTSGPQKLTFGPAGGGLTPTTQAPSWTVLTLPAGKVAAGHLVVWDLNMISTGSDSQCDLASLVDGALVNYLSDGYGPSQDPNGHSGFYVSGDFGHVHGPSARWIVQETDLAVDGSFSLMFLIQGAHVWGSESIPGQVDMVNYGPSG